MLSAGKPFDVHKPILWNMGTSNAGYQSLSDRFQRASDQLKEIEAERARRDHKRSELETFVKNLRNREMPVEEFDAMLWLSMVKRVTVEAGGKMRFTFANDMKVVG